jgi:hypothetical protein
MPPLTIPVEPASSRFSFLENREPKLIYNATELETKKGLVVEGAAPSDIGSTLPGADPKSDAHPVKGGTISGEKAEAETEPKEPKPERKPTELSNGAESFLSVIDLLVAWGAEVKTISVTKQTYSVEDRYEFGLFPTMYNGKHWEVLNKPRPCGRVERLAMVADVRVGMAPGAIYYIEPREDEATGCIMLATDPQLATINSRQHFNIVDTIRSLRNVWGNDIESPAVQKKVRAIPECAHLVYLRIEHRNIEPAAYAQKIVDRLNELAQKAAASQQ